MALSTRRGWWKWTLVAVASAIFGLTGATLMLLRPAYLESMIEDALEERLGVDVSIGEVHLAFLPRPTLTVTDVVFNLRQRNRPAFIRVAHVSTAIGPLSLWRGHVAHVEARGLNITVPPRTGPSDAAPAKDSRPLDTDIIVDQLDAFDAKLTLERAEPDKEPLVFDIHRLSLTDVGVDRVIPFHANLTNPVPEGKVDTTGSIGPWNPNDPTAIALRGQYTFKLVDLGSIKGIGGALSSQGTYEGRLTQITVNGTAETPDFSLDLGGRRLPLTATFKAVVDGSDGSTVLEQVDAKLKGTPMSVQGKIDNLPGPGRRHISLTADVKSGRIEDLLELVVDATPALAGDVSLRASVVLPPGAGQVRDRLTLDGSFGLPGTQFSDPSVRTKLAEFSRRSRGNDTAPNGAVAGRLVGRFQLAKGVLSLRSLTFAVPGAEVRVQGTYALRSTTLSLTGNVRMEATVSQIAGGWKGVMLRPFDFWFRRDGAGAVIPITISGNPAKPAVGVSMRRLVTRGD